MLMDLLAMVSRFYCDKIMLMKINITIMFIDIDECFQAFINEESICPGNQICQNIPSSFKCSCPGGSEVQGTACVAGMFSGT